MGKGLMVCDELENFGDWYLEKLEEAEQMYLKMLNMPHKYPERTESAKNAKPLRKVLLNLLERKDLTLIKRSKLLELIEIKRRFNPFNPHAYYTKLMSATISSRILYQLLKDPKPFVKACELFETKDTYVKLVKMLASVSGLLWLAFSVGLKYCHIPSIVLEKHGITQVGYGKYLPLFDVRKMFRIENVENLMKEIFVCEPYKFEEVGIVPKDRSLFVDLGAALGETTLWYSLYVEEFTSLAVEGSEEALKVLRWNLKLTKEYLKRKNANVLPINKFVRSNKDFEDILKFAPNEYSEMVIKMDIEGGEREVLKGIADLLKEMKPVLSVASYHLWDDLIVLPNIIKSSNDSYKLYLKPRVTVLNAPYGFTFNLFAK